MLIASLRAHQIDAAQTQLATEIDQREQTPAQPEDWRAVDRLDPALGLVGFEADQFQQVHLRDGKVVSIGGDDQGGNDRQGQGNLDLHGRPRAAAALNVDRAADLLDVGLDDVHADAACRTRWSPGLPSETGQEDQLRQFAVAHSGGLLAADQSAARRRGA